MANEATIVELLGNQGEVIDFTVADGTNISKGALMSGGDARKAFASGATGVVLQSFVGVSAADKEAGDGATNLGLYTKGIFDMATTSMGVVGTNDLVKISGANFITRIETAVDISEGRVIGRALEASAAGTAEVIEVAVGIY